MRERRLLAADQLRAFEAYCQGQGWRSVAPGPIDTLRMTHHNKTDAIVVGPLPSGNHPRYPLHDEAARMFDSWQEDSQEQAA